ncbi:MAG: hypothetical protein K2I05_00170 [Mailhella sp.]|nr:hypothetical protein [Mailhella sp.]
MYLDAELLFSHAQKISTSQYSDKTLDLGGQEGGGTPVFPLVQIVEGFGGLVSLTVHIQSADGGKPFAELTEEDWRTVLSSKPLPLAEIEKPCSVGFGSLPPRAGRYLRVFYEVEGAAAKGALTAGLVLDVHA